MANNKKTNWNIWLIWWNWCAFVCFCLVACSINFTRSISEWIVYYLHQHIVYVTKWRKSCNCINSSFHLELTPNRLTSTSIVSFESLAILIKLNVHLKFCFVQWLSKQLQLPTFSWNCAKYLLIILQWSD